MTQMQKLTFNTLISEVSTIEVTGLKGLRLTLSIQLQNKLCVILLIKCYLINAPFS